MPPTGRMGSEQENWICHCGNENYAFRTVCNRRSCQAPKPFMQGRNRDVTRPSPNSGWPRPGPNVRSMFLNGHMGRATFGGYSGGFSDQEWQCQNCGKMNWGSSMICNQKGCRGQHPASQSNGQRTWTCRKCGNKNYLNREICNSKKCDEPRPEDATLTSRFLANGDWECGKCGNLNYASRTVCNRKTCNNPAPPKKDMLKGPWICPHCSNVNYAERMVCNLKICGKPRPEDGGKRPARELPDGEWICPECGNLNYASRKVCNKSGCKWVNPTKLKPREWVCHLCKNVNWESRAVCNIRDCEGKRPKLWIKNGNWECGACGNLNFSSREVCNMSSCNETKPEWATELAEKSEEEEETENAQAQKRSRNNNEDFEQLSKKRKLEDAPDGSWICPGCLNLNWPRREVCNNRSCKLKRPDDMMNDSSSKQNIDNSGGENVDDDNVDIAMKFEQ